MKKYQFLPCELIKKKKQKTGTQNPQKWITPCLTLLFEKVTAFCKVPVHTKTNEKLFLVFESGNLFKELQSQTVNLFAVLEAILVVRETRLKLQ